MCIQDFQLKKTKNTSLMFSDVRAMCAINLEYFTKWCEFQFKCVRDVCSNICLKWLDVFTKGVPLASHFINKKHSKIPYVQR